MTFAARTLIVAVVASAGLTTAGKTAQAASFSQIDRLAVEFRSDASRLYSEFRRHYRHASHYRHLISDASKMYHLADHIHDVAHQGTFGHMADDFAKLDRAFHHLEDLVDDIENDSYHGHGHMHGRTRHVRSLLHDMEDTLHHLRDDIQKMRRPIHHHGRSHGRRVYSVPGNGPGITVGNGHFQFRLGF